MNARPSAETPSPASPETLRAKRRAARVADNRADILDAAERTFAERGLNEGSLRDIAKLSGFSTAAIYNYFENKQQLFAETLSRRGVELLDIIDRAANEAETPMARLHGIIDRTAVFFEAYPNFGRMLRRLRDPNSALTSVIAEFATDQIELFTGSLARMTGIVEDGQATGEIRDGPPAALIHLYMTLVYEHVYLSADDAATALTRDQFHDLIDGALRPTNTR